MGRTAYARVLGGRRRPSPGSGPAEPLTGVRPARRGTGAPAAPAARHPHERTGPGPVTAGGTRPLHRGRHGAPSRRAVYDAVDRPVEVTVMVKAGHLYELQYEFTAD
ncbi:hypothetical protein [Streptomyces sp. NPDC048272]|uniref:hypothetical protein n=1 Tax=Streptomyces sp. NPDC048272 TaxID=3154616 RepID=UPI003404CA87